MCSLRVRTCLTYGAWAVHGSSLTAALCGAAFIVSLVACELLRRWAMRARLLDKPNERSLHTVPTPRLGGVALVGAIAIFAAPRAMDHGGIGAMLVASLAIAVLGLVDDLRPLPASVRFGAQIAAASALLWRVGVPPLDVLPGVTLAAPSWVVAGLLVVWMVGVLNITNFMDGMDGLAGTQAIGASVAQALVLASAGLGDLASLAAIAGAASAGFLAQNAPPARIFMGDAGSTFLGFMFAALGVVAMHHGVSLATMALPISPFLLDGTFTILRRASKREAIWRAHRTHLYQRAVQTGLEHREVLLVYAAWVALALAATALSIVTPAAVLAGWCVAIVALGGVVTWVGRRESEKSVGQ